MLEGLLDSDASKKFITPLNDIIKVGITEKVLLSITDETIKICCTTSNKSNFVILKYKTDFLSGFNMPSVPFNFGVKDLSEVVGIMRAFLDGFKLKIEKEVMTISSGNSVFTYYGCNEKMCVEGPKKVDPNGKFFTSFKWDDSLKSFTNAINQLKDQEHIVISGNKGDTVSSLVVTNNQFKKYTNFSHKIQCTEVEDNFRIIINKLIFYPIVTSSVGEFIVKIHDLGAVFFGATDEFTIVHAASSKVK